jgi:ribosome-associated protein
MGNMRSSQQDEGGDDAWERGASKSARKRDAHSLQELGVQLAALPGCELGELNLPDNLSAALRDLRRLPTRGAQLRQRQYIGKLMRDIDPEPLLAKLHERKQRHDAEVRHFQRIENWRDRLLKEPDAIAQLLEEFPAADRGELCRLLEKAARERIEQRSPSAARELFDFLRRLLG